MFALVHHELFELIERKLSCVVWVCIGNHAENLRFSDALIKEFEGLLELRSANHALLVNVELHEALPYLLALFSEALLLGDFGVYIASCFILLVVGHLSSYLTI